MSSQPLTLDLLQVGHHYVWRSPWRSVGNPTKRLPFFLYNCLQKYSREVVARKDCSLLNHKDHFFVVDSKAMFDAQGHESIFCWKVMTDKGNLGWLILHNLDSHQGLLGSFTELLPPPAK